MRRIASLCAAVALGAGMMLASSPASHRAMPSRSSTATSERQMMRTVATGRYVAPSPGRRAASVPGLHAVRPMSYLPSVNKGQNAPARVSDSGASVYGAIATAPSLSAPKNVAEVFLDGKVETLPVAFPAGPHGGPMQITGLFMRGGNFMCFVDEIFTGQYIYGSYLYEIASDGTVVSSREYDNEDYRFTLVAYDPSQDMLYGYVVIDETLYFATASGADPLTVTLGGSVNPIDWPMAAITYNQVTNKLIGIAGSSVVEISTANGTQTKIGTISDPSEYITGLAYSPWDGGYYYVVSTDAVNGIQLLDESDFSTLSYAKYDDLIGYYNLFCPDLQAMSDDAPGDATLTGMLFPEGALSGRMVYRLPSATYAGVPMMGNLDWILEIDGTEYKRGSAAAGSELSIAVDELMEGNHTFTLKVSRGGKFGPYLTNRFYIGHDTPCAPAHVTLTSKTVEWDAVTTGVNDGYVNSKEVTYNVYVNNKRVGTDVKGTSCSANLPQGEPLDTYVATVIACYKDKRSDRATSADFNYGDALSIPAQYEPSEKQSKLFTIVDGNGDGTALEYVQMRFGSAGVMGVFQYTSHRRNNANEWLYLPLTHFDDANAVYEFSMNAMRGSTKPETVEVYLTSAADGNLARVVGTILPSTSLANNPSSNAESLAYRLRGTFTVPQAGDYYVAVRITSARNRDRVILRDFSLNKLDGITIAGPKTVTSLKAKAAPQGELKADVSFNFPTASINEAAYAADKKLKATVQAEGCQAVSVEGKAGDAVQIDVPALQGENTVNVTVTDGDLKGLTASVNVYVGVEAPAPVRNVESTVDETGYKVHLKWAAPTQGADGGYIQPTGIKYYLYEYTPGVDGYTWVEVEDLGEDVTECDFELEPGTPQSLVQLGIIAENFAGRSRINGAANVMGEALSLPSSYNLRAAEGFQNPTVNYSQEDVDLVFGDPAYDYDYYATDDNAKALYSMSYYDITDAFFTLPKISTKNCVNAAVELDVWGGSTSSFSVTASASGVPTKIVKTFKAEDFAEKGPQKVIADLPAEFQNKDWVEIGILYNTTYSWFGESEAFILYAYRFFDNIPYDFGVTAIEGPAIAAIGEENLYKAHVMNFGNTANAVPASNWKVTDGEGKVISDVNVAQSSETVAPGEEAVFNIAFTPTADQLGTYHIAYTLQKGDGKEVNDAAAIDIRVAKGTVPVITDLRAGEVSCDKVVLQWSPVDASLPVLEGFEDEDTFVLDAASDKVAEFKRYDGDGQLTYGPRNDAYQQQPYANQRQSFVVWSQAQIEEVLQFGEASPYKAFAGDKFLIAFCPGPDENGRIADADDWLISPEIVGGSSLTFSMKPITYQYGSEKVEILYSTGGDDPDEFQLLETIETEITEGSPVFKGYDILLPDDAKYFAIHYVSHDVFGIILDDINYVPVSTLRGVKGFDIYRDGQLLAAVAECPGNRYEDTTVRDTTDYTYVVVPVLNDDSRGAKSNTLVIRTLGVSGIEADEANAEYFSLQGVRLPGKPESGICIRRIGSKVEKITVSKEK